MYSQKLTHDCSIPGFSAFLDRGLPYFIGYVNNFRWHLDFRRVHEGNETWLSLALFPDWEDRVSVVARGSLTIVNVNPEMSLKYSFGGTFSPDTPIRPDCFVDMDVLQRDVNGFVRAGTLFLRLDLRIDSHEDEDGLRWPNLIDPARTNICFYSDEQNRYFGEARLLAFHSRVFKSFIATRKRVFRIGREQNRELFWLLAMMHGTDLPRQYPQSYDWMLPLARQYKCPHLIRKCEQLMILENADRMGVAMANGFNHYLARELNKLNSVEELIAKIKPHVLGRPVGGPILKIVAAKFFSFV